jgi:hypothetical protein
MRPPEDLPSGVYALRSRPATSEDHAVFFVMPARDVAPAAMAWLTPTITYRAYANIRLSLSPEHVFGNWSAAEIANDRCSSGRPLRSGVQIHGDRPKQSDRDLAVLEAVLLEVAVDGVLHDD